MKITLAKAGQLAVSDLESLVGLLGFVCFILKLKRGTLTPLYEFLALVWKMGLGPQGRGQPTRRFVNALNKWAERLVSAHGAPITVVLPSVEPLHAGQRTLVWYGDAAVEGTNFPGLCGFAHGLVWVLRLSPRLLEEMRKYITALEFLVLIGNLMIYGATVPAGVRVLLQSDSLVSVRVLGRVEFKLKESAKAPLMRYLLGVLQARPEYQRLKEQLWIGQAFGEGNNLADNGSRGDLAILVNTCDQLGAKLRWQTVPQAFMQILEDTAAFASKLKDEPGLRAP
jgi:hypothetical protein